MIRTHSLIVNADKNQLMMQIGWYDPEKKMLRTKMQTMLVTALRDFQTRCKLIGKPFDVEDLCDFCVKREAFGDNVALVNIIDGGLGIGAEWRKEFPPLVITNGGDVSNVDLSKG